VHYAGRAADIGAILELGLPVIEDAAHAVDSSIDGQPCGTFGTLAVFSFDAVKNVATPDGGGIASRDAEVMATVRRLRSAGCGTAAPRPAASTARRAAAGGGSSTRSSRFPG
jgi:dTDP-4-amino-4,6-dideoxygalactose transaminase